ncbi:sigma-54-dependent transcriptional regulator [Candidatus Poribacteria bacterium]
MRPRILIADDEPSLRLALRANLKADYDIYEAEDGLQAVEAVRQQFFDLVLMDIRMPGMDGLDALAQIKQISPGIVVFLITAYESLETVRTALRRGASDYISKPVDAEELKAKINHELEYRTLLRENTMLKERLGEQFDDSNIIARSPKMREVLENVALIAPTDATVLILGASGTGKELIANLIHERSSRASGPFVKLNCAAITETLLESELFGHERGSFTGATARKEGRFELADGGSFLLDEIGEMSSTTQTKLLRVLQEQQFERVGGTESITVDLRIIAATNKDLGEEVKAGRFREDLYYRLNVVPIYLPPLRERREDIPLLAEFFLKHYATKNHRGVKQISPEALDLLMRYDWPGNVRELENAIERGVIIARGERLTPAELPLPIRQNRLSSPPAGEATLKEMEREWIAKTLTQVDGNRTKAAEILGITRKTLQNKIKEYGLDL